jgi:hypothetical protein
MIGMAMRQQDCAGPHVRKVPPPIRATVDHDAGSPIAQEKRAVPPVPAGPSLDLPARAEKDEFHPAARKRSGCCTDA